MWFNDDSLNLVVLEQNDYIQLCEELKYPKKLLRKWNISIQVFIVVVKYSCSC